MKKKDYPCFGGRKMDPKDAHASLPAAVDLLCPVAREIKAADGSEVTHQMTSTWGEYPGPFKWPQYNHNGPYKWGREAGESVSERHSVRKIWLVVSGFEDITATGQGRQQPLEARKCKNVDTPLEPPEKNLAPLTPWFCTFQVSDLQSCKVVILCCFKLLGVW